MVRPVSANLARLAGLVANQSGRLGPHGPLVPFPVATAWQPDSGSVRHPEVRDARRNRTLKRKGNVTTVRVSPS